MTNFKKLNTLVLAAISMAVSAGASACGSNTCGQANLWGPTSPMVECVLSSDSDKGTLSADSDKGTLSADSDKGTLSADSDKGTLSFDSGSLELTTVEKCRANNGVIVF